MSAAVEPTQPTDEAVELACRAFQTTVEDFDHLSPDWPDWRDGVTAALAAAYPVMVKQAIADERERIAQAIEAHAENEAARTNWDGMAGALGNWVNGIREGVRYLRGELPSELDAAIRARAGGGDQ